MKADPMTALRLRRPNTALLAASILAIGIATASFAAISPASAASQQPEARPFKLGAFSLVALHDAQFILPNDGKVFGLGVGPAAVTQVLQAAGAPTETITLSVDALLVKTGDKVVLIDTGVGGALQGSLKLAKVKPAAVTDILITHAHPDHIGGLVIKGALAFPNAKIRMASAEWSWLQGQAQNADIVKVITPQVEAFEPGAEVVPGITAVDLKGHTPGHSGYEIVSGNSRLLDFGDTAHSSIISLAKPTWHISFDTDGDQGEQNRIDELAKLAKSQETIFAPHFPFPGVGKIEPQGDHYVWKPTLTAK
jgi:glyoxylase-like metal-dependent hydrolase (beta-lactamase superfamily II)